MNNDHLSTEIFSALIDDALESGERARALAHLGSCATCRAEHAALREVTDFLRGAPPRPLPPGADLRLSPAQLAHPQRGARAPAPAPEPARHPSRDDRPRRTWSWLESLALGGFATAAVTALAFGLSLGLREDPGGAAGDFAPAAAPMAQAPGDRVAESFADDGIAPADDEGAEEEQATVGLVTRPEEGIEGDAEHAATEGEAEGDAAEDEAAEDEAAEVRTTEDEAAADEPAWSGTEADASASDERAAAEAPGRPSGAGVGHAGDMGEAGDRGEAGAPPVPGLRTAKGDAAVVSGDSGAEGATEAPSSLDASPGLAPWLLLALLVGIATMLWMRRGS